VVGQDGFPPGFFDRVDDGLDPVFYSWPRLVKHIDDAAVDAVGRLYEDLRIQGNVLDLMGSWVSHFRVPPARLTVLGMNADELNANEVAADRIVHDLNADPTLPFDDASFDAAVCCVSVDYLTHPIEVFGEVARVLRARNFRLYLLESIAVKRKGTRGTVDCQPRSSCGWT
jgi:SAM-dependent methyltransferase